jgi:hypothetical protein
MTRKEAIRLTIQGDKLRALGFTREEAAQLRRISMTLRRWFQLECGDGNGAIERDETTGIPYWYNANSRFIAAGGRRAYTRIADRETGARKRLAAIMEARALRVGSAPVTLTTYVQTDPRGAALYILRPGDVPEGEEPECYYSRGLCVY